MSDRYIRNYRRYIVGNEARKIDMPEVEELETDVLAIDDMETYEPEKVFSEPVIAPEPEQTVQKRKKVSIISVILTLGTIFLALYICVFYVNAYSEISSLQKEVDQKKAVIARMEKANELAYEEIDSSVNLRKVYKTATKKLGMVYPSESQIYTYNDKTSGRVIQYAAIPGVNSWGR